MWGGQSPCLNDVMRDDFLTLKDLSALAMALGAGLPSISKRSQLGLRLKVEEKPESSVGGNKLSGASTLEYLRTATTSSPSGRTLHLDDRGGVRARGRFNPTMP
jgi:hypothetical protein